MSTKRSATLALFASVIMTSSAAADVNRQTVPATWEAQYSFSPAVVTRGGRTVWLAGQVGHVDDKGNSLAGNFEAQVHQTFRAVEKVIQRAGGQLSDVVTMNVFINDARYAKQFTDLRAQYFPKDVPASTLVVVIGFAQPEIMVEVTATAVIPD